MKEINEDSVVKALSELAEASRKKSGNEKNKPKFRFNNSGRTLVEVIDEVSEVQEELDGIGFQVEVLENIECHNVTKEKRFNIRITDNNNTYVEIPLDSYMQLVNLFDESPEDYIAEKLMLMTGGREYSISAISGDEKTEKYDTKRIADLIADELSYLVYFNELQTKVYSSIGWDEYEDFVIFKYDRIYANTVFIQGKCTSDFAEDIKPSEEDGAGVKIAKMDNGTEKDKAAETAEATQKTKDEDVTVTGKSREVEWFDTMRQVMNDSALASLILAAGISGLIREILPFTKETNINMNICGDRATGKSTICHLLLSIFGDPTKLESSFLDTDNSMEIARAKKPVLPYVLDERMLRVEGESKEKKKQTLIMEVFREYEGKVKERMAGSYKKISGNRTTGPVISSSVESMLDILLSTNDLGQFRRFIEVELTAEKWIFKDKEVAEKAEAVAYSCYGYGVQMIINYMLYCGRDMVVLTEYFRRRFEELNKDVSSIIEKEQKSRGVKGLSSSSQRLTLILLSYEVLRNSLLYWVFTTMEIASSEGFDSYLEGDDGHQKLPFKHFEDMRHDDTVIENKGADIGMILLDNLFYKMENVLVHQRPVSYFLDYIEKYREAFYNTNFNKNKTWDGDNRTQYIGKLGETEDEYIITLMNPQWKTHYLIVDLVEPAKISKYLKLKDYGRTSKDGSNKDAEAVSEFRKLTDYNEQKLGLFLKNNPYIQIEGGGKEHFGNSGNGNGSCGTTVIKIKKKVQKGDEK